MKENKKDLKTVQIWHAKNSPETHPKNKYKNGNLYSKMIKLNFYVNTAFYQLTEATSEPILAWKFNLVETSDWMTKVNSIELGEKENLSKRQ